MKGYTSGEFDPRPICWLHQERFGGGFIEYTTKEREVVKICIPCVMKCIDEYIENRK